MMRMKLKVQNRGRGPRAARRMTGAARRGFLALVPFTLAHKL